MELSPESFRHREITYQVTFSPKEFSEKYKSFTDVIKAEMREYLACCLNPFIGRKIYLYVKRLRQLKYRGRRNRQSRNLAKLLFNQTHMRLEIIDYIRLKKNEAQA